MKVILLAAGRSNRVKPILDKNFLMFCGKPLIEHQLEQLYEVGLRYFVIIGGAHNLEKLQQVAEKWANYKVSKVDSLLKLNFVTQENLEEGMAGAIKSAKAQLQEENILIVSSNDIVDAKAYKSIIEASQKGESDCLIVGMQVKEYFPGGYLMVKENNLLTGIIEKPGAGNEPSNLVNLVIHFHRTGEKLLKYVEETVSSQDDLYETALDKMMKDGLELQVVEYDGFWQAIKYPWHIFEAAKFLFHKEFSKRPEKISPQASIASTAVIKGDVLIEDGAKVFENAVIQGPCYIGRNCVIANNALVRESFIGAGSVAGFTTEIARSFIGENVWTHSNYIGDSIIGSNVSFGAGTVTGNLRLDEKNISININGSTKIDSGKMKLGLITGDNIRCGINVSFMPGVKIGSNTFIGAGITISEDIDDNKFVYGKTELKIKENTASLGEEARKKMKEKL